MRAADYPEIEKDLMKIPADKFITNYMPYPHPHNLAYAFFVQHKEYTHLIVQPQDLHATKEDFTSLIKTVKDTGYDIVSCVCNVEREGHPAFHKWAICKEIPNIDKNKRYYKWVPESKKKLGLMQVEFQGMVFCCISRRIVEKIDLKTGTPFFKGTIHKGTGDFLAAPDLTFCHCCKNAGVPIWANTDIRLKHYSNHKPHLVGIKEASTKFIQFKK